jgi:uncharacterized membrane protein YphA (DoxX/SURF4 family)
MFRKLIATDDDVASLILRVVTGIAFFAHGAQLAEFLGSLGLIVGLQTRVAAFGIGVVMTAPSR